jgi:TonB family protein
MRGSAADRSGTDRSGMIAVVEPDRVRSMNARTTSAAALLAVTLFLRTSGAICQEPVLITENDAWARPLLIVPPSFPKDIPAEILPVVIRIEGTVKADGTFSSPAFTPAEGRETFVHAIGEVLQHWRFRPAVRRGCQIKESRAVLNVYFETKEGKPSISISSPPVQKPHDPVLLADMGLTYVSKPKIEFPNKALQAGIEGFAEICMVVDTEGEIVSKTVISSLPNVLYGEAAMEGFSRAKFKKIDVAADNLDANRCVVVPVNFCMGSGNPAYPQPGCRH